MRQGRVVPVLLLKGCDSRAVSNLKEDRFVHNIDGLRQVNYLPGPSREDVQRILDKVKGNTYWKPLKIVLTNDGYIYTTYDTPGYCDGEITVNPEILQAAIETTTTIY